MRCEASEDLGVEKAGDQNQPAADLGGDQRQHERVRAPQRRMELVGRVAPPAMQGVAGHRRKEVEGHRAAASRLTSVLQPLSSTKVATSNRAKL